MSYGSNGGVKQPKTRARGTVAGKDDALHAWPDRTHLFEEGEVFVEFAVGAGDDDAEGSFAEALKCVGVPGGVLQGQTRSGECAADLLAHLGVASDDKDPAHKVLRGSGFDESRLSL